MTAKKSFESSLKALESAVARLEGGEMPLEEALTCFEDGVRAAGNCQKLLQEAELKVEKLISAEEGKDIFEPFSSEKDED